MDYVNIVFLDNSKIEAVYADGFHTMAQTHAESVDGYVRQEPIQTELPSWIDKTGEEE